MIDAPSPQKRFKIGPKRRQDGQRAGHAPLIGMACPVLFPVGAVCAAPLPLGVGFALPISHEFLQHRLDQELRTQIVRFLNQRKKGSRECELIGRCFRWVSFPGRLFSNNNGPGGSALRRGMGQLLTGGNKNTKP
jgi:hypothetical protein